jgi:3-phosphoshikimate 1-carboxyvinyltransferase
LSSAAFFISAALLRPGSGLTIRGVGVNPRRAALLTFLQSAGASIDVVDTTSAGGELSGDLRVRASGFRGGLIEGQLTAALIDEIPVLAVLGAASEEGLTVRDAEELRFKETDRIATIADNLARMGVSVETSRDGLHVAGRQRFRAAEVDSHGDHRIAMALAVAALAAEGNVTIHNAGAASVSFPEFWKTLESIRR